MDGAVVKIAAAEDREKAVATMKRYRLNALPVVDSAGVLLGVVTIDDALDVAEREATEDFHKAGAIGPLPGSFREAGILRLFRSRIGWLLVLVGVNLLSGAAIARYEDVLLEVIALVFFLPLLIASSGNAGAQAATLVVRSMATGDVAVGDWARLLARELGVALVLGVALGAAVLWVGVFRGGFHVGVIVALSMVAVVTIGSLLGLMLPVVLSRLKLDPATASVPLVTSLADILGVLIYFSIATAILGRVGG